MRLRRSTRLRPRLSNCDTSAGSISPKSPKSWNFPNRRSSVIGISQRDGCNVNSMRSLLMNRQQWDQIESSFHAALELDPHKRANFLAEMKNADVRSELESLLRAFDSATQLERSP